MLIAESIERTWQCDGLDCPTGPIQSISDPFYNISVTNSASPFFVSITFDLCDFCIKTITAPVLVQDIADAALLP